MTYPSCAAANTGISGLLLDLISRPPGLVEQCNVTLLPKGTVSGEHVKLTSPRHNIPKSLRVRDGERESNNSRRDNNRLKFNLLASKIKKVCGPMNVLLVICCSS